MPKTGRLKVWVTRSQPGADRSVRKLRSLGYDAVAAPLLTIGPPPHRPPLLQKDAILIVTSQNALWSLFAAQETGAWPIVCVGDITAVVARGLGFENVLSASGTSREIAPLIQKEFPNEARPFVHVSGETVRGEICEDLQALGYKAERHVYYASHPVRDISHLNMRDIDAITFYSPKAAQIFKTLAPQTAHMTAISISAATDQELSGLAFAERLIAPAPNEASMFRMLD